MSTFQLQNNRTKATEDWKLSSLKIQLALALQEDESDSPRTQFQKSDLWKKKEFVNAIGNHTISKQI